MQNRFFSVLGAFLARVSQLDYPFAIVTDGYQDATLLIIGHGSTKNANSSATVFQHAAEIRRRGIFKSVVEGFWKEEPFMKKALADTVTPRVFIVPLFISGGYFTQEAIPLELGFRKDGELNFSPIQERPAPLGTSFPAQTIYYCEPIGTHSSMTAALIARATNIIKQYPFPRAPKLKDVALFIAGHGTEQNENSRKAIDRQVDLIRAANLFGEVHAVFIEETPRIRDCYSLTSLSNLVVVPFFISQGMHSAEDIPILLGEPERVVKQRLAMDQPAWRNPTGKYGKLVWYTQSIGSEPQIAEVILQRVAEVDKRKA